MLKLPSPRQAPSIVSWTMSSASCIGPEHPVAVQVQLPAQRIGELAKCLLVAAPARDSSSSLTH